MTTLPDLYAADPTLTAEELLAAHDAQPPEPRVVPMADVKARLLSLRLIGRLTLASQSQALPETLRGAVAEFLAGLTLYGSLDATDSSIRGDVMATTGGLVQASVMTQAEADSFASLLAVPPPSATLADAERVIRQHQAALAITPLDEAIDAAKAERNDYDALLSLWVATGEGAMPTLGGAE